MAHPLKARIINTPQTACFLIVLSLFLSGVACLDTKPNCANLMPQYFADFFASRFAAERFSGTTCCRIRTSKSQVPSGYVRTIRCLILRSQKRVESARRVLVRDAL